MPKFLKPGKVVVLLRGRQAGKKAVIVSNFDDGTKERPYGHALLAGIERSPLKVTRKMTQKKIASRIKIKPFLKFVNYAHFMPTRYLFDLELKAPIEKSTVDDPAKRKKARSSIRKLFEARHKSGKNKWFFTKLRF